MHKRVLEAATAVLGNPFQQPAARWQRAVHTLLEHTHGRLGAAARKLPSDDLERVVLALGHVEACAHPHEPRAVLADTTLPANVLSCLPRSRGAYRRVVMAAGRAHEALSNFRGHSPASARVRSEAWAACFGDSLAKVLSLERVIHDHDVLVMGETGTGKESIALAIQQGTLGPSGGKPAPRSAVNAAAIPETLIASELFGHEKGAFTGATEARAGRIRSANGGCFFLDEVADLQPTTQVKLLRVMETNMVSPLGADVGHAVEVRYVAATHGDLEQLVDQGRFRRDLYQRLAGNVLRIPPLRERIADIPDIGRAFLERYQLQADARVSRWLKRASRAPYAWPGNVRELQNALRNLLLGLDPGAPSSVRASALHAADEVVPGAIGNREATLRQVEDWYITAVLDSADGSYAEAARRLGVDRSTVRRRAQTVKQLD